MNYIIILFMVGMSIIFSILSFIVKGDNRNIFLIATAFFYIVTGILVLGNGIEVPIGTLTTIIR